MIDLETCGLAVSLSGAGRAKENGRGQKTDDFPSSSLTHILYTCQTYMHPEMTEKVALSECVWSS